MTLIRLILQYLFDFARANLSLALQVLSPRMRLDPQIITLPTEARSPIEVLALSNLITFTPGSLTLDVQPGQCITVHVLRDAQASGAAISERLEKPLLKITRSAP